MDAIRIEHIGMWVRNLEPMHGKIQKETGSNFWHRRPGVPVGRRWSDPQATTRWARGIGHGFGADSAATL
jgi:hypothetical protein